jgi:hypothetical protein
MRFADNAIVDRSIYKSDGRDNYRKADCCCTCLYSFVNDDNSSLVCHVDVIMIIVIKYNICDKFKSREE